MNIEIISSSPRKESRSHRVALFLQAHLSENSPHQVGVIDLRDWPLPQLQDTVIKSPDSAEEKFRPLAARMFAADAFIFVTPEYNGSYTSALKNLMDHFPKQGHKSFGIVTASDGPLGGIRASQQLQLFIHALFGIGSPYMLIVPEVDKKFDPAGRLLDQAFTAKVHTFVTEFLWLSEALHARKLTAG